jgi:hypothetical protein
MLTFFAPRHCSPRATLLEAAITSEARETAILKGNLIIAAIELEGDSFVLWASNTMGHFPRLKDLKIVRRISSKGERTTMHEIFRSLRHLRSLEIKKIDERGQSAALT